MSAKPYMLLLIICQLCLSYVDILTSACSRLHHCNPQFEVSQ